MVVIKFYASWCRACKAMAPKIDTIAEEWPGATTCAVTGCTLASGDAHLRPNSLSRRCHSAARSTTTPGPVPEIEFFDLMFDNNKKLCKSLGIKVLPYIEIVAGSNGKVESFSCGPSKISKLQEKLETHGCDLREDIPCTDVSDLLDEA